MSTQGHPHRLPRRQMHPGRDIMSCLSILVLPVAGAVDTLAGVGAGVHAIPEDGGPVDEHIADAD